MATPLMPVARRSRVGLCAVSCRRDCSRRAARPVYLLSPSSRAGSFLVGGCKSETPPRRGLHGVRCKKKPGRRSGPGASTVVEQWSCEANGFTDRQWAQAAQARGPKESQWRSRVIPGHQTHGEAGNPGGGDRPKPKVREPARPARPTTSRTTQTIPNRSQGDIGTKRTEARLASLGRAERSWDRGNRREPHNTFGFSIDQTGRRLRLLGGWPGGGGRDLAQIEHGDFRSLSTRAALYAWSWSEMA
jgi:hypothetical protein